MPLGQRSVIIVLTGNSLSWLLWVSKVTHSYTLINKLICVQIGVYVEWSKSWLVTAKLILKTLVLQGKMGRGAPKARKLSGGVHALEPFFVWQCLLAFLQMKGIIQTDRVTSFIYKWCRSCGIIIRSNENTERAGYSALASPPAACPWPLGDEREWAGAEWSQTLNNFT